MIQPNWNLLLWFLLVGYVISGIINIYEGAVGAEKSMRHDYSDIIAGIIKIIFICLLFVFGS